MGEYCVFVVVSVCLGFRFVDGVCGVVCFVESFFSLGLVCIVEVCGFF